LRVKKIPRAARIDNSNEFRPMFLSLFNAWRGQTAGGRVVILLDEVDKYFPGRERAESEKILRAYVGFFRVLRALAQEQQCLSVLAVAYRPEINRQNLLTESLGENPMHMAYQEYFLRFLSQDDTIIMLRELGRWQKIEWDKNTLSLVHELSGGHPLISRQIASDACDRGQRKRVTMDDVEEVGNEIRSHFSAHRVGQYIDESIWQMLRAAERTLLSQVAMGKLKLEAVERQFEDACANLQHFGLIVDSAGSLEVNGTLFKAWVERNGILA
jgi:hypothetical protein